MKTIYEIHHTETHEGQWGFCPDDFNVERKTTVVGRFETYDEARAMMLEYQAKQLREQEHFFFEEGERGESWSNRVEVVEVAESTVTAKCG